MSAEFLRPMVPVTADPHPPEVRAEISDIVRMYGPHTELTIEAERLDDTANIWQIWGKLPNHHVVAYRLVDVTTESEAA